MRPIKLEMSAFGSYSDKVVIDFSKVNHGLFLITGDTGAGKTTIFDAITYALYGQTSGGKRDGNMMRSQYASEETDTYVNFCFSYRGEEYVIRRNPEYLRLGKRRYADGSPRYVKESSKVELTLPDGNVFQGKKKETDQKIVDIMGMDVEQFTQIAMIAQGDFLKLLHAESKERKRIFSRIFHTNYYFQIQETLKKQASELYYQLQDNLKDLKREMERVEYDEAIDEMQEWKELLNLSVPSYEQIEQILKLLIQYGKTREKEMLEKEQDIQIKLDQLKEEVQKAEALNQLFADYENACISYKILQEQETLYQTKEVEIQRIKSAEKLNPFYKNMKDSERFWEKSVEEIQKIRGNLSVLEEQIVEKKKAAEDSEEYLKQQEAGWSEQIHMLKDTLPQYAYVAQLEESRKKLQKDYEKAEKELQKNRKKLENILQDKAQNKQIFDENAGCESESIKLKTELEKVRELLLKIDKITEKLSVMEEQKQICTERLMDLQNKTTQYRESAAVYEAKYQEFLNEQAGVLAAKLEDGIPCPVCGSLEHPAKHPLKEGAPTQQEVEVLKQKRDKLEAERDQKTMQYQEAMQAYEVSKSAMLLLYHEVSNKKQEEPDAIGAEINQLKQGILEKKKVLTVELEKAVSGMKKCKIAAEQIKVLEEQEVSLRQVLDNGETVCRDLQIAMEKSISEIELCKKKLIYASKEEAKQQLEKTEALWTEAKKDFEKQKKNLQMLQEQKQTDSGKLQREEENCKELEKRSKISKETFQKALDENEMDVETFQKLILNIEKLPDLEADVEAYKKKVQENIWNRQSLEKQLAGKEKAETEILKQNVEAHAMMLKELKESQLQLYTINKKNKDAKDKIKKIFSQNESLQKKYEMVSNLSRTANGGLSGSVKMDFETYVQRQYFKQIINAANKRLVQMTSNEFILQCRDVKNLGSQGQAGLELDVYHMVSDSVRDVKTLSGGESFMAALSMALGLADIVQNSVGGIKLETMFVDEGFGSLDDASREQAIKVLNELAGDNRLVGIISHVNELKEQIDTKLIVSKTEKGSIVKWDRVN